MGNIKKTTFTLVLLVVMMISVNVFAQDANYNLIKKEFTKEQIDLLQKEREVIKANRKAFKKSLTENQLAILRDKTISKTEIRKRLVATFSRDQKNMVQN